MKPIGALGAVCLLMGGCSHLLSVPTAYTSLPHDTTIAPSLLPADGIDDSMLPVVVPGQFRGSAIAPADALVDPRAALRTSINARAAWTPLKPAEFAMPQALAVNSSSAKAPVESDDPTSTASVSEPTEVQLRRAGVVRSYNREAAMDRLEEKGRADAKPICTGC